MSSRPSARIAIVLGTRPEAVKLAPVVRAFGARGGCEIVVISTGQHRELLQQMLAGTGTIVHHDLALGREGDGLAALAARGLDALDPLLARLRPDFALVQGDTTSAFVGALACFYRRIPVGHVEAGLRTHDLAEPFPEEGLRRLVTPLAALHFAPTELARTNLLREGVAAGAIHVTGNPVVDALLHDVARQAEPVTGARIAARLRATLPGLGPEQRCVLVTCHRRENQGAGLAALAAALRELASGFPELAFVLPLHPNPSVAAPLRAGVEGLANVHVVPALDRELFLALLGCSHFVLTDSGGVQEEAPLLGKPVLVLRDRTERPEGVAAGSARLVGTDPARIVAGVRDLMLDAELYRSMAFVRRPYGDGQAGPRIVDHVLGFVAARARQP